MHAKGNSMTKPPEKPAHISQQDWDAAELPGWTAADMAQAVPFNQAHPDAYGAWKRGRGRPTLNGPAKKNLTFRLPPDLIESIRATGKDYNVRVEKVLRDAFGEGKPS